MAIKSDSSGFLIGERRLKEMSEGIWGITQIPRCINMTEENLPSERKIFEGKLYKAVAYNLRIAREISGLTAKEAQNLIWNYRDGTISANRISEMESGNKKIDLQYFFKACEIYNCSADFLLGFSDEFERDNLAAKHVGVVFQSMRSSVLEATEQLCMNVNNSITRLPKFEGEMLKTSARQLIDIVELHSQDWASKKQYSDLLQAVNELKKNVVMFELFFAKQQRQFELYMMDLLENGEDTTSNRKLTQYIEMKKPEKV